MDEHPYYTKIGADGSALSRAAAEWEAVTDNRTGLMWSLETKKADNWKAAQEVPGKIKAAGFTDWRMPTAEELFLLVDRSKFDPAIDSDFFPDCPSDWFWTSTVDASSPGVYAWGVGFNDGYSDRYGQGYGGFVRAVRGCSLTESVAVTNIGPFDNRSIALALDNELHKCWTKHAYGQYDKEAFKALQRASEKACVALMSLSASDDKREIKQAERACQHTDGTSKFGSLLRCDRCGEVIEQLPAKQIVATRGESV